jgi:hypothetical protein
MEGLLGLDRRPNHFLEIAVYKPAGLFGEEILQLKLIQLRYPVLNVGISVEDEFALHPSETNNESMIICSLRRGGMRLLFSEPVHPLCPLWL